MQAIAQILKYTKSIMTEIIPGNDYSEYIEKKTYSWQLQELDSDSLSIKFSFDYPEFISFGEADTMKIQLFNTDSWLIPTDESKQSLPDGYEIMLKLSPQGKEG